MTRISKAEWRNRTREHARLSLEKRKKSVTGIGPPCPWLARYFCIFFFFLFNVNSWTHGYHTCRVLRRRHRGDIAWRMTLPHFVVESRRDFKVTKLFLICEENLWEEIWDTSRLCPCIFRCFLNFIIYIFYCLYRRKETQISWHFSFIDCSQRLNFFFIL